MSVRVAFLVLVCICLVFAGIAGIAFHGLKRATTESSDNLTALRATLSDRPQGSPEAVTESSAANLIRQLCLQAQDLNTKLAPELGLAGMAAPLTQLVSRLPEVGSQAAGKLALASSAGEMLGAGQLVCTAVARLMDAQAGGADVSAQVMALAAGHDELRQAVTRLRGVQSQLESLESQGLDQSAGAPYLFLRDRLPQATDRLALLAELPEMLGAGGPGPICC